MENQIILNILISFIIAVSVSYYYLQKFNYKFIFYSIILFLILFVIFYLLGPKNNIESFHGTSEESCNCPETNDDNNDEDNNDEDNNDEDNNDEDNNDEDNNDEENNDEENISYDENEESILNEENVSEEFNQEEMINTQEEYMKKNIDNEEEENEEEEEENKKKNIAKHIAQNHLFNKAISGNNNQFNPGIGVGISPVNIYINGQDVDVDKFNNKKNKKKHQQNENQCNTNYFKKASRIYNNCDWTKNKKEWCDESYNYDKNCGNTNNLLPCSKVPVTNIPQTLNNLVNSKKTIQNGEPCPLEINQPWSNYKTGDDKEKNELLPEGFNL